MPAAVEGWFAESTGIKFGSGQARWLKSLIKGRRTLLVTGRRGSPVPVDSVHHIRVEHEPTVDDARRAAALTDVEVVVAIGGGSAIDLGKAAAALIANGGDPLDYLEVVGRGQPLERPTIPCIFVPTTAGSGAEVTNNAVLLSATHGVKASLRMQHVDRIAVVDPELTYDLPPALTASTGLDALTQLIEPYVGKRYDPLVKELCVDSIYAVIRSLPNAFAGDREARSKMSFSSVTGGLALVRGGLGAVHGLAGPIGGRFPAPHGAVCGLLLPHVVAINAARSGHDRFARLAQMTGDLAAFVAQFHLPPLSAYGMNRDDVPSIVAQSRKSSSMKNNPVELSDEELTAVLLRAL
jgi:alcohol dehydrogenase class IV